MSQNTNSVLPIRRALLSVYDKSGVLELARALHRRGVEILSTGGTARLLRQQDIPLVEVGEYTGFPEMMDGRVKTLHPRIHGGLLARRDLEEHQAAMRTHDIPPIDLVAVNLYPFESVAAAPGVSLEELIENIDIGGPSMLRSAAKNHDAVTVLCDPADYAEVIAAIDDRGGTDEEVRRRLARKVFARTAAYDATIASTLNARATSPQGEAGEDLAATMVLSGSAGTTLRYGENPHQRAAVYRLAEGGLDLAGARPLQGKELSYNNLLDADAALFALRCLVDEARAPSSAVIIKHGTPCGAARAASALDAFRLALAGDPVSAFGGIVALGSEVDEPTARAMGDLFLEVVLAPAYSEGARAVFESKKNLRLLELNDLLTAPLPARQIRSIPGGLLVQDHDRALVDIRAAQVVTKRAPTDSEWDALDVAFRLCTAVRSNAITLARGEQLIGAGGGQTSRVDSVRLAVEKANAHGHNLTGAALGSDAFFPFPDGLQLAIAAGVTAVAQPGGSKKDHDVIAAADAAGIAMVFTGERHFRH